MSSNRWGLDARDLSRFKSYRVDIQHTHAANTDTIGNDTISVRYRCSGDEYTAGWSKEVRPLFWLLASFKHLNQFK